MQPVLQASHVSVVQPSGSSGGGGGLKHVSCDSLQGLVEMLTYCITSASRRTTSRMASRANTLSALAIRSPANNDGTAWAGTDVVFALGTDTPDGDA